MRNEIEYYVNEEKRTVVAKIFDVRGEIRQLCAKYAPYDDVGCWPAYDGAASDLIRYIHNLTEKYPKDYYAVARAHEKDTWDVEIGKKIARARLLKKINSVKRDVLYSALKYMQDNIIYNLECAVRFYNKKADKQEKKLEDILGTIEG